MGTSADSPPSREPRIDRVVSVCCLADIATWQVTAAAVVQRIRARQYVVIVPDAEVAAFRGRTVPAFTVVGEGPYLEQFIGSLDRRLRGEARSRRGWYIQQFIKLAALAEARSDEIVVLWDADTVPLRELTFLDDSGRLEFFTSTEYHRPYFATIRRLLGMQRAIGRSFVAQSFPTRGSWVHEFRSFIEDRHGTRWFEAIVDAIDFSEPSGFSEYETLGTFLAHSHAAEMAFSTARWSRCGNSQLGGPRWLGTAWGRFVLRHDAFVAFEKWDPVRHPLVSVAHRCVGRGRRILAGMRRTSGRRRTDEVERFLARVFASPGHKTVVQVGANDGVQNDPLRRFLVDPGSYSAVLVEPLPHYASRLRDLYRGRPDITVVEAALGAERGLATIYSIPPALADQMNGTGPANDWAHGQGSFDRDTVIHWIEANRFRGEAYARDIPRFIAAIEETSVAVQRAADVMPAADNVLLCIDVQGRERDVLLGVDWARPPRYVLFEDDLGAGGSVVDFLAAHGYRFVCGDTDKVFEHVAAADRMVLGA